MKKFLENIKALFTGSLHIKLETDIPWPLIFIFGLLFLMWIIRTWIL